MPKKPEIKIPNFVVPETHDYDLIDINFLKKIQGNPLGKTDLEKLKNSISSEGLRELPILSFDPKTERILLGEGNHRVEALRQLGYTHVPVRTERSFISEDTLGSKKFKNPANFLGHDPWRPESTYVPANLPANKFFPEETKNKVILPEEVKNEIISSKKQSTPDEEIKKHSALTSSSSSLKNKLLNKAFKVADVVGMSSDVYKGNIADALVSAAEMAAPKLGTAASRFAPLLELLRPTEMEPEDDITSDFPGAHSRKFKKLKSLFEEK